MILNRRNPQGMDYLLKGLKALGLNLLIWVLGAFVLRWLARGFGLPDIPAAGLFAVPGGAGPQGWRFFLYGLVPLAFFLFALAGELLAAWITSHFFGSPTLRMMAAVRTWRKANLWAFAALPLLAGAIIWHDLVGDWPLLAGSVLFMALGGQAFIMGRMLWVAVDEIPWRVMAPKKADWLLAGGTSLLFLAVFVCLSFWTAQVVLTGKDEQIYLANTSRPPKAMGFAPPGAPGRRGEDFPAGIKRDFLSHLILRPGKQAAGRIGALAMLSLSAVLGLASFYWLLRRLEYPPKKALAASWLLGSAAPFLQGSQHVSPAALGALGLIWGMHLLLKLKEKYWLALLGLAFLGAGLIITEESFLSPVAGLALAAAWLAKRQPGGLRRLAVTALGLLVLGVAGSAALYRLEAFQPALPDLAATAVFPPGFPDLGLPALAAAPALFFDQQFGLLIYCPWLALGLLGLVFFWRDRPEAALSSGLVAIVTLAVLLLWRWRQWDGGFSPPGRLLAPLLPLFFLWAMPALRARSSPLWRGILVFLAGTSAAVSLVLSFRPIWRFNRPTGANNLLRQLGDLFDTVAYRFFPSFIGYYGPDMLKALPWAALLGGLGVLLWRERKKGGSPGWALTDSWRRALMGAAGAAAVLLALLVMAGRVVPTRDLGAKVMQRWGGLLFATYYPQPVYLVLNKAGDRAFTRIVTGTHTRKVVLLARRQLAPPQTKGAQASDQLGPSEGPLIKVSLDGKAVGVKRVRLSWARYSFPLSLPPGVHHLQIDYKYQPGDDQVALDRIFIN